MSVVTLLFCVAVVLLLFHYIFSNAQNRISFSLLGIGKKIINEKGTGAGSLPRMRSSDIRASLFPLRLSLNGPHIKWSRK